MRVLTGNIFVQVQEITMETVISAEMSVSFYFCKVEIIEYGIFFKMNFGEETVLLS